MNLRALCRFLSCALLLCPHLSIAQGTSRPASFPHRYQVTVWQDKDGLPQNSVLAIARTRDGYLWLGTVEGLVRFDGVRFTVFDRTNTPEIGNSHITALLEDRGGTLWIGTAGGGLTRYTNGRFSLVTVRDGLSDNYVAALAEDGSGSVWVGTLDHGLNRWSEERWTTFGSAAGLPNEHVQSLAVDTRGDLWVGMDGAIAQMRGETLTAFPLPDDARAEAVGSLCGDRDGALWVGTTKGLRRFETNRFVEIGGRTSVLNGAITALSLDQEGGLWVGGGDGAVYRQTAEGFSACPTQDPLPTEPVRVLRPDANGDVWVGTYGGGLVRLRHGRIGVYTMQDGLSSDSVRPILQDATETIWIGTTGGLNRFIEGVITSASDAPEAASVRANSLTFDAAGRLFVDTGLDPRGVARLENEQLVRLVDESIPPVIALLSDRAGNLWSGTTRGLFILPPEGGGLQSIEQLREAHIESLFQDRVGQIWIGSVNHGLSRFADGNLTTWKRKDGLPDDHVLGFYEDREGALWIGTHGGGLVRRKDDKFATITSKDGLYDDLAFSILEDDAGDLWMSGNKGIYRASLADLNAFADGGITRVRSYAYDAADGMISRECNGASPAGWKMRDGTLWFPTIKGVAVVDPNKRNLEPPRMIIERVTVDRFARAPIDVHLNPGQEDLEIQYTGLSWERPQQVRFEYQLTGLTRDWTDAGTRRTAYFSHLPIGTYAFQVRADNGDGVWSVMPATLRVVVLPPFWRTWWFLLLSGTVVAGAVALGVWTRGRQLRRRYAVQREFSRRLITAHETERRRVAAELHDGLGQTLAMIKNSALSATRHSDDRAEAQRKLEQITEQSAHAIGEMREIAHNLRPYLLDRLGLTKALRSMLNKAASPDGLALEVDIDEIDGLFSPEAEMSIYRIVQESVNNILHHSGATRAAVRVVAHEAAVHLTIDDKGRGFDVNAAVSRTDRGFGLLGIAERVGLLDGTYAIDSAVGAGTRVSIQLPHGKKSAKQS